MARRLWHKTLLHIEIINSLTNKKSLTSLIRTLLFRNYVGNNNNNFLATKKTMNNFSVLNLKWRRLLCDVLHCKWLRITETDNRNHGSTVGSSLPTQFIPSPPHTHIHTLVQSFLDCYRGEEGDPKSYCHCGLRPRTSPDTIAYFLYSDRRKCFITLWKTTFRPVSTESVGQAIVLASFLPRPVSPGVSTGRW